MATVSVRKIDNQKPAPISQDLSQMLDQIRNRAFELFELRGGVPGQEANDWIQAERDLFWVPPSQLSETDTGFSVQVAVPGFDSKEIQVFAQPGEVLVRASSETRAKNENENVRYTEFGAKSLYRRFELAAAIDTERTTASIENGILTITAPKKKTAENVHQATA